jgi:hypothetical protein
MQIPLQAFRFPRVWGSQNSRQSVHEGGKAVSAAHRPPLSPGNNPVTHFSKKLSQPQGHSGAGKIISIKNFNDTVGNRTRYPAVCSVLPQPTAPPRAIFIYLFTEISLEVSVSKSLYVTSMIRLTSEQWFGNYVAWSPSWLSLIRSLICFQEGLGITTTTLIMMAASTVSSQPVCSQNESGLLAARWVFF